jgi:tetraacyldisaccharide 4'-kinase
MLAPQFWNKNGTIAKMLWPVSLVVQGFSQFRFHFYKSKKLDVPVICVGNIVVGGSGKTPTALDIGRILKEHGVNAHYLSRGYGGNMRGPVLVDTNTHTYKQVGDEPLLLARQSPAWVSKNRLKGALAAIKDGAEAIIMDDGLQNPLIEKNLALLVIDSGFAMGNKLFFPSGPLRESLSMGLKKADAVVVIGEMKIAEVLSRLPELAAYDKPVFHARFQITADKESLKSNPLYAFAGIGRPEKFFESLEGIGARLIGKRVFGDHHPYSDDEMSSIIAEARALGGTVVTTEKDFVRIPAQFQKEITPIPVKLLFDNVAAWEGLIKTSLRS